MRISPAIEPLCEPHSAPRCFSHSQPSCNVTIDDHHIRQIDKERYEILAADNHTAEIEANRELRLLLHIYTGSKCVSSR